MSDVMTPISFSDMLTGLLAEYRENRSFYGVPVVNLEEPAPIGPAAGPHTQLAGNIVSAYGAGAVYFELKTVQVLEGKELQLQKPCIYVENEVYNTEWSTELTVKQAADEYIKAYLLLQILSREFALVNMDKIHFVVSVGYDLAGIQSEKIDAFLESMKNASKTKEWKQDITFIKEHMQLFQHLEQNDIEEIQKKNRISDSVTLSTMHGCKSEEIEQIVFYLMKEKGFYTYVKLNPTLIGKDAVKRTLQKKGYQDLEFDESVFQTDMTLDAAKQMIMNCQQEAKKCNRKFGVKLTNTFPVRIKHQELAGETMYLSGTALYPLAVQAVKALAEQFSNGLKMSYSGGADVSNIKALLETGLESVTVSSILLKPGGYKNITKLQEAAKELEAVEGMNLKKLSALAADAVQNPMYCKKQKTLSFESKNEYSPLCAVCNNCVDVCPNRANVSFQKNGKKYVIHRERLCNECGCCVYTCVMGHKPYLEKFTVQEEERILSLSEMINLVEKRGMNI